MRQRLWLGWGRGTHCFLRSPVTRSAKTQPHLVKVLWNLKASVIKTQKSSFFLFFTSALKLVPFFYQHISMTCGCRPSTRTCSTEVSLYRLKKSRVSIDFSCAPLYSVLAVYERPGPEFNLLVAYGFGSTKTSGFGNLWRTCRSDPLQKTSLQSLQQLFVCHLQRIAVNFHPGFLFMGSSFIKGRHII